MVARLGLGERGRYPPGAGRRAGAGAAGSSRPGTSGRHRHRPDPSGLGGRARRHAQEAVRRGGRSAAHRLHEDVQAGAGRRQARAGPGRRPAGMVLQGRRRQRGGAGSRLRLARLRPGRRRGAGDRRPLSDRPRRHAAPAGLCAGQRVLRPCHREVQLSVAGPFQAAAMLLRARTAHRPPARRRHRLIARPARQRADLRQALPVGRGQYEPHHRQPGSASFQI